MKLIIKLLLVILTLNSVESAAAPKKVRKPSYIVKNYQKLPKKMPKLKAKQERIPASQVDLVSVVTLPE